MDNKCLSHAPKQQTSLILSLRAWFFFFVETGHLCVIRYGVIYENYE